MRRLRRDRSVSQEDLAVLAEVSRRHISFVETGRSAPSRELLERIAVGLALAENDRATLLEAAGFFAPPAGPPEHPMNDFRALLRWQSAPAVVHDVYGTALDSNPAWRAVVEALLDAALPPFPIDGHELWRKLAPRMRNWRTIASVLRARTLTEAVRSDDTALMERAKRWERDAPAMAELSDDMFFRIDFATPRFNLTLRMCSLTIGSSAERALNRYRLLLFVPHGEAAAARVEALLDRDAPR